MQGDTTNKSISRRTFIELGSSLLLSSLMRKRFVMANEFSPNKDSHVNDHRPKTQGSIGQTFLGEELTYTLSLLFFRNAGTYRINLRALPEKKQYLAEVRGQTQGFIGMVTWFRKDLLTCRMEEVDDGKRLRPLELNDDWVIGNRHRRTTTVFDYHHHQIVVTKERGERIRTKTIPLPEGETYYDAISGSYNFRFGVFGPIERGREYVVKIVPEKKYKTISIRVGSFNEEKANRPSRSSFTDKAHFITLQVNKDLMRSKTGRIELWLSSKNVPTEGKVKDVIFFGDVVGTLTKPKLYCADWPVKGG